MRTKNIFKALALAMLMPAMMLTTACSNEDDLVNNTANTENTINKGYALPVTVNVTRQGDEGTRASYNESTRTLSFSTGDKLFVSGYYDGSEKQFAGTLDYDAVSGKFSGTIYTESEYTGTAEAFLAGADDRVASLVPAGYDTYGYLSIKNEGSYEAYLSRVHDKEFALTKKAAVEQFSSESAFSYSSGFALAPDNAILSFTISGLTANKEVAVSFNREGTGTISGNVTTSATGVATFAVGVHDNCELEECTLTVDGNNIALPTNTVDAGHIYNISRSVPPVVALEFVTFTFDTNTVKVATMNLGATTVAESAATCYGNYYAWGATTTFATVDYTAYNAGTVTPTKEGGYINANAPFWNEDAFAYTKYTSASDATLEAADDAVAANMPGCHMPTQAEVQTLCNACGVKNDFTLEGTISEDQLSYPSKGIYWVTGGVAAVKIGSDTYKVNGMLFVQDADTHVFFPAAGRIYGTNLSTAGSCGYYRSSSLKTSLNTVAYYMYFYSSRIYPGSQSYARNYGFPVRPFKDAE